MLSPRDSEDLVEIVADALATDKPLELISGGTKRNFGRTVTAETAVDLSELSPIVAYEPGELTLTTMPGVRMKTLNEAISAANQQLAFEPPDFGPLFGREAGHDTLGGVLSCNLSGPRRIIAGSARDHLLGFTAVNGFAQVFKAGGKVVKNVTGYDLAKLMTGSFGTLAALTEVTIRTLPRPETITSVLLYGASEEAGLACIRNAIATPFEISAAAALPAGFLAEDLDFSIPSDEMVYIVRIEGFESSVAVRAAGIRALWQKRYPGFETILLEREPSLTIWRNIGMALPLIQRQDLAAWRLHLPATSAAETMRQLIPFVTLYWYDWGGGLIWLGVEQRRMETASITIRKTAAEAGGYATLVRADGLWRERFGLYPPPTPALSNLQTRLKNAFDPRRLLNRNKLENGSYNKLGNHN